jgi:tetratricopeptide (TPR) repeat protein
MTIEETYNLARQRHFSGHSAEAEVLCNRVLAEQPRNANAMHLLGLIFIQTCRPDLALDWISRAIAIAPTAEFYFNQGLVYFTLGRHDEAVQAYQNALTLQPDLIEAHNNVGNVLLAQGRYDLAIASFQKVLAAKPFFADAHNNLGIVYHNLNRFDEAITSFRRALAVDLNHPKATTNLGVSLYFAGRAAEAVVVLRQAIVLQPNDARSHENLGTALSELGKHEEAAQALQRAVSIQPDSALCHRKLGIELWHLARFEESVTHFRHALALEPRGAENLLGLGAALWHCGDTEEAIECNRRALAIQPNYDQALANLPEALGNIGRFDEAAGYYQQLVTLMPPPPKLPGPRPESARFYVVCSIRNGRIDLLPHWLDYYSRLNPDEILIGVFDDVAPDIRSEIERYSKKWRFKTFAQTWKDTSELDQQEQHRIACRKHGATDHTWIAYTDLDEFHQYPVSPRELLAAADKQNIDVIYGWLLDRVAEDGSLPAIPKFDDPNSQSLWDTFAMGCRLTGRLLRAPTRKVMLARLGISVGSGHHAADGYLPHPIPLGRLGQYVVHHFKWHAEAVPRLEWGLAHADRNPQWQRESNRFLNWLKSNGGRVNMSDPEIMAMRLESPKR